MIIGGGQIPVTTEVLENVRQIKLALDWAADNGVEIFLTPECALSGYTWTAGEKQDLRLKKLPDALAEVVEYSKEKKVDLALGTGIYEDDTFIKEDGKKWFNQLRFYSNGELIHKHNKMLTTIDEPYNPGTELTTFEYKGQTAAALICNDLWVCGYQRPGDAGRLARELAYKNVKICFLAVNAPRIKEDPDYFYTWSDIHVQTYSRQGGYVIMVSENSYGQDGRPWSGTLGAPSGVMDPNFGWVAKSPKTGTHYFKWEWKHA